MRRRLIPSLIAVEQLVLSLLFGWLAVLVPYGRGVHLPLAAYALWGLISAFALFSGGYLPQIIALPWHTLFVAYVLFKSVGQPALNQGDRIIQIWAVADILPVIYLARTAIRHFRKQSGAEPAV